MMSSTLGAPLGGTTVGGHQGYRVWCIFHDATGLVEKSRVQIAGLNIGQIVIFTVGMTICHSSSVISR